MFEAEYKRMMDGIAPTQEVIWDTLAKAQCVAQGKRPVRRVRGIIVLATLLLFGILSASAITLGYTKVLDLKGADVTEEYLSPSDQIILSATPSPAKEQAHSLIGKAPDNEYWSIWYGDNTMTSNRPGETITSLEQFKKRVTASGSRFLIPQDIPTGYMFDSAEIEFYLSDEDVEDGLVYLGTEKMPYGVRIYKYRAPDSVKNNIMRYFLRFQNKQKDNLTIACDFGQLASEHFFFMGENGTGEAVAITGMLEGIYLKDRLVRKNELCFRTMYLPDERIVSWPAYPPPVQPGIDKQEYIILKQPADAWPFMVWDTMEFSITATALDKDQLIKIAEGLR